MVPMLDKKNMSEEDIKLQYITPAVTAKWDIKKITMETKITDGKVNLKGNFVFREKPKRADYILYLNANNPIAVIEAKDNNHSVSYGLQQAMTYAQMLDIPFAYSSNGDGFAEHDFLTGKEREFNLDEFPTEEELIVRYKQSKSLTPAQETVLISHTTAARLHILLGTISVLLSTERLMLLLADRIDCCLSWLQEPARPIQLFKSFIACCRVG